MRKIYLLSTLVVFLLAWGYIYFFNSHVLMFYDSFIAFTDENYYQTMYEQWKKKSSNFLLTQLSIFNDEPRFSTAAFILTERNEKRAIKRLRAILNSHANSKIKRTAIFRLVNFGDEKSIDYFLKKAHEYRKMNLDFYDKSKTDFIDEYRDILQALSSIQFEEVYPLVLDLAKNGKKWERGAVLSSCLFYYKKHSTDIIPIYTKDFFEEKKSTYSASKASSIRGLEMLGSVDAVPILKYIAEKEPEYRREAERAIKSLEVLKDKK